MRFLALWQPWASLMALRRKRNETRSWRTDYRGLVGICATKAFPDEARAFCLEDPCRTILREAGFVTLGDLPRGAVVAVGELVACVRTYRLVVDVEEAHFGNYEQGRYAWQFPRVLRLLEPIPCRCQQGLWTDPELEAKVRAAMEGR